jgi:hypothetical protein
LSFSEFVEVYVRHIAQLPGCDKVAFDPVNRVIRFEHQAAQQHGPGHQGPVWPGCDWPPVWHAGDESLLRFDGVYRVKQQSRNDTDQEYCYLRLYPDKTALYTTSAENPSELAKSFNVKSGNVPQGDYKLSGDTIRIEIRASNATLAFSGKVNKNRLLLESKRFANGPATKDEFLFMGWLP